VIVSLLFWLWLGGIAGQALLFLVNPDVGRGVKSVVKNQMRRWPTARAWVLLWSMVGLLVQLMIWPLHGLLAQPLLNYWKKRAREKGIVLMPVTCACCGEKSEVVVLGDHKWVSFQHDWYVNEDHEAVCSAACAAHIDFAHPERNLH